MSERVTIAPAASAIDLDEVRALLRDYAAALDTDLGFQAFDDELRDLPGDYAPPRGGLWLARLSGRPVGCIAMRSLDERRAEMKRLYVRPAARGAHVGAALVEVVLAAARSAGHGHIVLDVLPSFTEAQRLYARLGFTDIAAYCHNPVAGARWLGKPLA